MKFEGTKGLSRRGFLGGVFSLGAFAGLRAFAVAPGSASYGTPNLRVGVISDIHVSYLPGAKERKPYEHGSGECFLGTLQYFDQQKVDAVLVAGDLTNFGDLVELQAVSGIWKRVFPENRRSDGEKVEPIIVYGNHDAVGFDFMHKKDYEGNPEKKRQMLELSIFKDPAGAYEAAFGEKWGGRLQQDGEGLYLRGRALGVFRQGACLPAGTSG